MKQVWLLQGLRKEPEFEGYIALAQRFNDGWLPVQQLASARPIIHWARQNAPEALNSPEEFLSAVQKRLESEKMTLSGAFSCFTQDYSCFCSHASGIPDLQQLHCQSDSEDCHS